MSKHFFKKADEVVITSGSNKADALAAAPLANLKKAPILLTKKDMLSNDLIKEIERLGAKKVTIIGGESSVSSKVVAELEKKAYTVKRISGNDRYETSIKLAEEILKNSSSKKIIAVNGMKNADALAVASIATKENLPTVMIKDSANQEMLNSSLAKHKIEDVLLVGGQNSISNSAFDSIKTGNKERLSGKDRYETSKLIAEKAYPNPKHILLGNGEDSVDALAAGALTSRLQAPIVFTKSNSLNKNVKDYANKTNQNIYLLGGKNTINIK